MSPSKYLPVLHWLEAGAPHKTSVGNLTFCMNYFTSDDPDLENYCGTACCIAGATQQFSKIEILNSLSPLGQCYALGEAIGLTLDQSRDLFLPEHKDLGEAAKTLRHFIETGEIKW